MTLSSGRFRPGSTPSHNSADPPSNRSALLVIRAWREDGAEDSLRARITEIPNLDTPYEVVRLASTREDLHSVLDRWLDRLLGL